MAFLTGGEFYEVTFKNTNDAAWDTWIGFAGAPDIPSAVTAAMCAGTTLLIYVIDDTTGSFAYVGGSTPGGWDDTLLVGTPTALPDKLVTTDDSAATFVSCLDSGGGWNVYWPSRGTIVGYDVGEASALKAFLP